MPNTLPKGPPQQPSEESKRPLIIERPDLQTLSQRWGYRSVTLFCWLLWLYLFVPLLSFLAWLTGLSYAYRLLLQDLDVSELWSMLSFYALGIAILAGTYLLWALYSYLRFRNVERRQGTPLADLETLAASHNLKPEQVQAWQRANKQTIDASILAEIFVRSRAPDEVEQED
ncbi:MAG: poly-beta-1,6-N-acetyl-D-glucosamine biosynthesis protein PgaD [Pseudomonadales bacterium]